MRKDLLPVTYEGQLSHIVEETGEVLFHIGKMQRFGATARDPMTGIRYDNLKELNKELNQLKAAIERFQDTMKLDRADGLQADHK